MFPLCSRKKILFSFFSVGKCIGKRPKLTVVICLLVTITCILTSISHILFSGQPSNDNSSTPTKIYNDNNNTLFLRQNSTEEIDNYRYAQPNPYDIKLDYDRYFDSTKIDNDSRMSAVIIQPGSTNEKKNILAKKYLLEAMDLHYAIQTGGNSAMNEKTDYTIFCAKSDVDSTCQYNTDNLSQLKKEKESNICNCRIRSILGNWNYNRSLLEADNDYMNTLNIQRQKEENYFLLDTLLHPTLDDYGNIISAEAFTLQYFLNATIANSEGEEVKSSDDAKSTSKSSDNIIDSWEKDTFLVTVQKWNGELLKLSYMTSQSFHDELHRAIMYGDDIILMTISFLVSITFLGKTLYPEESSGSGSSFYLLAFAVLSTLLLSIGTGNCISSLITLASLTSTDIASVADSFHNFGTKINPTFHQYFVIIPYIMLALGINHAFLLVNAFNRELKSNRTKENDIRLAHRSARSLYRAAPTTTLTSTTLIVAFSIYSFILSSKGEEPTSHSDFFYWNIVICIFMVWFLSTTFFPACIVLDERRQRDNRCDILFCLPRKKASRDNCTTTDGKYKEDFLSLYFRNFHAPAILSPIGKVVTLLVCSTLVGTGIYGCLNLSMEDTTNQRLYIPKDSYIHDYLSIYDDFLSSNTGGNNLYFVFQNGTEIFSARNELGSLEERLRDLSRASPYIAEPIISNSTSRGGNYRNVMTGYHEYLKKNGGNATMHNIFGRKRSILELDEYGWPINEADFIKSLRFYSSPSSPGRIYSTDVSFSEGKDGSLTLDAIQIKAAYMPLTKTIKQKITIDDADRQINAMDETLKLVKKWEEEQSFPNVWVHCDKYSVLNGFKLLRQELFTQIVLVIVTFCSVTCFVIGSIKVTIATVLTMSSCLISILGFMHILGIIIDSLSVINIALSICVSVDYCSHLGYCYVSLMRKKDDNKKTQLNITTATTDEFILEALADVGASILYGAIAMILVIIVLFFSSSFLFRTLAKQLSLTIFCSTIYGLCCLPVLLSLVQSSSLNNDNKQIPRERSANVEYNPYFDASGNTAYDDDYDNEEESKNEEN